MCRATEAGEACSSMVEASCGCNGRMRRRGVVIMAEGKGESTVIVVIVVVGMGWVAMADGCAVVSEDMASVYSTA